MSELNDPDLIERLRDPQTCRTAFEDVIRRYSQPLYWQIRRMVISHDDANDLLQNTFLKAWSNIEYFRGEAKLSTWLYKIAINESLTFIEKEKQRTAASLDDMLPMAERLAADPWFDGDELQAQLQDAISTLPDKQRMVFNMRYFDEMKYEDISEALGTSVGALKASFHHAVKKIENFFASR